MSALATAYIRLVGWTSRITYVHGHVRREQEVTGGGFLYAFWHGRQLMLTYLHRGDDLRPLISKSADGDIIAEVCRSFGLEAIRGSTSRGGAGALLEIQRAIEAGQRVSVTPDGPRGPLQRVQPGALFAAQKTGAPIVPVAYGARRYWVFGGWDRFIVPSPFNRLVMVYGNPLRVNDTDSLDQKALELQAALDNVAEEADRLAATKGPL